MADLMEWLTGCLDAEEREVREAATDEETGEDESAVIEPARAALARVEAERAIAREHAPYDEHLEDCSACGDVPQTSYPCPTLRLLAWGHRFDFPGYLDEWTPEATRG